jgi:hypothetical protein
VVFEFRMRYGLEQLQSRGGCFEQGKSASWEYLFSAHGTQVG